MYGSEDQLLLLREDQMNSVDHEFGKRRMREHEERQQYPTQQDRAMYIHVLACNVNNTEHFKNVHAIGLPILTINDIFHAVSFA